MLYDVGFPGNRREIKKYQLGGQDSKQNSSFVCDLAFEVSVTVASDLQKADPTSLYLSTQMY